MSVQSELQKLADPARAKASAWFFKTGPGQYGEGDQFIGIKVPGQRTVAKRYKDVSLREISRLLASPVHEYRLTGIFILVYRFRKSDEAGKKKIYDFYLTQTRRINNWDLVDSSAGYIVGAYLLNKPSERPVLLSLAKSKNMWERRIAIIATQAFIVTGDFDMTLKIAQLLLGDTHDLIHKAVGWMLREVGKRDQKAEEEFLKRYYKIMPRTMLRYAIERFPEKLRMKYLMK